MPKAALTVISMLLKDDKYLDLSFLRMKIKIVLSGVIHTGLHKNLTLGGGGGSKGTV